MCMNELCVRPLQLSDQESFLKAIQECACDHVTPYTFAFHVDYTHDFTKYLRLLEDWSQGKNLPERFVANTFLVGVVGDTIVGRISVRHELNEFLATIGGHIGYVVIPSERKKGYGTSLLSLAKPFIAALGLSSVLVTCDDDDTASIKIIESNGGVFENVVYDNDSMKMKRRYWIAIE